MEALSVALILATAIVAAVLLRGNRRWWREALMQEHRLLLAAAMASYGLEHQDALAAGRESEFEQAKLRCDRCDAIEQCVSHLAARHNDGLERFCPNAALWSELRAWKNTLPVAHSLG